ncbi:MAG: PadR family transcriptional regulator [Jiangellales bacterium]
MNPMFMTYMSAGEHHSHAEPRGEGRGKARSSGRRGRGRRAGPGGTPWPPGGPDVAFGLAPHRSRGRAGRGNVRAAVLLLLAEQPRHGYEIITQVVERSEGRWQPSPGSVYPVLKRLAGEGLVRVQADGDRRVFELTDAGRAFVDENADELGEPWTQIGAESESTTDLLEAMRQVATALTQVARTGDEQQIAAATALMTATKRNLYRVLAGDPTDQEAAPEADPSTDPDTVAT